jgi:hypothetical protein
LPFVECFTHEHAFRRIQPFFPGLRQADLPDAAVWAIENVRLCLHNGTHLGAAYHAIRR